MRHILQRLSFFPDKAQAENLARVVAHLYGNQNLVSPNLRIQGGSGAATWQSQADSFYLIDNVEYRVAAAATQAVPSACTWAAVASTFNATGFLITADRAGSLATIPANNATGTSAVNALAGIQWPPVPEGVAVIGAVIIRNTTANVAFTAASTNLDASNISTTFINITGPFFPTASL